MTICLILYVSQMILTTQNNKTSWGSWLTLEKYREPAFKTAYETFKNKYEHAMKDGPSEIEKSIYYRYFYFEQEKSYG